MVFSSHLFVFYFLPLALAVYYLLPRRARHLGLTVLSYGFYGWANPAFVFLMLFSTAVDYLCALAIAGRGTVVPQIRQCVPLLDEKIPQCDVDAGNLKPPTRCPHPVLNILFQGCHLLQLAPNRVLSRDQGG